MPKRSNTSQIMLPEVENLRIERHRFLYISRNRMYKAFSTYLKKSKHIDQKYGIIERRNTFIDPRKVKQRSDLIYLLLTDPKNWDRVTAEKATAWSVPVKNANDYENLSKKERKEKERLEREEREKERYPRNKKLALQYDARLSVKRRNSHRLSPSRHADAFLGSLPSNSLFTLLYTRHQEWPELYEQYKLWVADEVSIACEALDDFIAYLDQSQDASEFLIKFGGDRIGDVMKTFASTGRFSVEEVTAAVVAAAKRIGSTDNYRLSALAVKRILRAWSAYRKTPAAEIRMKGQKPNRLNLQDFAKNLGL